MNPVAFIPLATTIVDELIQLGHMAAERRGLAIMHTVETLRRVKDSTVAKDYFEARAEKLDPEKVRK